jgi:hypothetical protein
MIVICDNCKKEHVETPGLCSKCKLQTPQKAIILNEGTVLENRYKIINLIKAGKIKNVYKILDNKFNNILVLQEIIPPDPLKNRQKIEEWFNREISFSCRTITSQYAKDF